MSKRTGAVIEKPKMLKEARRAKRDEGNIDCLLFHCRESLLAEVVRADSFIDNECIVPPRLPFRKKNSQSVHAYDDIR